MAYIKVFTKEIVPNLYEAGLANSVHFLCGKTKESAVELYQGYGILFPKAQIREDNTIDPRGALNPLLAHIDDDYLILCDYVNEACENTAPGKWWAWKTTDFVSFKELGLIEYSDVPGGEMPFRVNDENESVQTMPDSELEIPEELLQNIFDRFVPIKATGVRLPKQVANDANNTSATEQLPQKVEVIYSDGSICEKHVTWEDGKGTILSPAYKYPLTVGFADPVLFKWKGMWYFLATNDINGNIGIFMREAKTIDGLFEDGYKESVILDYDEEKAFIQTFWAPEWHIFDGAPYILFAVGGKQWAPQSHVMKYKGEGSLMDPLSWEKPVRFRKKDGSFLCEDGITLDMTYLRSGGRSYVIWSERYKIGTPLDSGSMLYIGEIDEKNPTGLISDKVLLARPLFGWENVGGTINNEGPYALQHEGKIYVAYSGGAACGHTYAVGYLMAKEGSDLLDPDNWEKQIWPALTAYSVEGVDGPGHNSFFVDDEGNTMIAYHGQPCGRASAMHRVHFDKNGYPVLNMSPARDLPEELKTIIL